MKWLGILIGMFIVIFGMADQGRCDSNTLLLCGVDLTIGKNVDASRKALSKQCKITEIDSNNFFLNDREDKLVGNIFHKNNKVLTVSRRWNSYAENTIDEMEALIDALNNLKQSPDDMLVANIVISESKSPGYIGKDLSIYSKGKRIQLSIGRLKGKTGPSNYVTIDEKLE